ncbi:CFS1-like protein [Schizophyllum amplum]|uniref:CFS1-like protein n=1 Tax=Schizophyllum amplum TaxID=97359 RepID=A0A550C6S3_9AGAR|nr:CFS1-like protein [Auriculariopsis ampla]
MRKIDKGQLRILTLNDVYQFPARQDKQGERKAELRVSHDAFWLRLCLMGDLGFSEAYMYSEVECDDLVTLFLVFLDNRDNLVDLDSRISYLYKLPQKLTSYRFLNTISNSRSNISAHYDISNAMFAGFLSKDMTYSCGIFADLDGDLKKDCSGEDSKRLVQSSPSTSSKSSSGSSTPAKIQGDDEEVDELYEAQIRKLDHIIKKVCIWPGNRVLEIGSGWGSMAIRIAQTVPGTTIDTITLSSQQLTLAEERIAAAGLSDRIRVHLMDYRDMPAEWEHAFDRLVSVEMIEAVGREFIPAYFAKLDWALKLQNACGVIQSITIPEARFERYIREVDFIRKWVSIFPGGFLPTLTFLLSSLTAGSAGRLTVDSVSNIGPHYARTLREWRRRFLEQFEGVIEPALMEEHPEVMGSSAKEARKEVEVFKRKWICEFDYYCYCEVGFTTRTLGDHIVSFTREGFQDYGCDTYV